MKRIIAFALLVAVFAGIGLGIRAFGVSTLRIAGMSMSDTLASGDVVLVTRFDYRGGRTPGRGEIVECRFPGRSDTYVKRVIGLPGEMIAYEGGALKVNGTPVSEPYVTGETADFATIIEDGRWFLMGDNRTESYDSRAADMGPVGEDAFIGKVRWILWPLTRFGPVD